MNVNGIIIKTELKSTSSMHACTCSLYLQVLHRPVNAIRLPIASMFIIHLPF